MPKNIRRPRIFADRLYIIAQVPGISGFQRWNEREYRLVSGIVAKNRRGEIAGEWLPTDSDVWAIEDGHIPGHQPTARNASPELREHVMNGGRASYIQTVPPKPYFKNA